MEERAFRVLPIGRCLDLKRKAEKLPMQYFPQNTHQGLTIFKLEESFIHIDHPINPTKHTNQIQDPHIQSIGYGDSITEIFICMTKFPPKLVCWLHFFSYIPTKNISTNWPGKCNIIPLITFALNNFIFSLQSVNDDFVIANTQ